ncbi:TetR/AcrR family transcriptional regulator [Capillimicrobium parvum]|uniref:HTH tetR-type domain-containing protein n=1 Tax=Capillimicrobium parvum TaxID=2884022 RepID=A0A9E6XZ92_9ACTN|nr:TetR family transcriptional regulator [Capillimicrobium parvum]UGS37277.1 hypothetical protein DSM104329_03692 [Capillimicrobium parvum]
MSQQTAPRRIDRQRRERILTGALVVIGEHGVEGLTHRRAAEAAGVPLSAPSYYFASIEDLLEGAMREAAARDLAVLRERFAELPCAEELPTLLASHIADALRDDPGGSVVISELYVAALRRESLREVAVAWDETWLDLLTPVVGRPAAIATTIAAGGLAHRALLGGEPADVAELEAVLRVTLGIAS